MGPMKSIDMTCKHCIHWIASPFPIENRTQILHHPTTVKMEKKGKYLKGFSCNGDTQAALWGIQKYIITKYVVIYMLIER